MNDEISSFDPQPIQLPKPRPAFVRFFVGPDGLRAGWKVLLFFLILEVLSVSFQQIMKLLPKLDFNAPLPPLPITLVEFLRVAAMLLATGLMARFISRKPWGYFGMPVRNAFRSNFWIGAVIGLGVLALQLEVMHLGGWFDFGTLQLRGPAILGYGLLWGVMFVFVGLAEEGSLRGYVQRVTTDGLSRMPNGWGFWTAAVLFSLLFAQGHRGNPGETKFGIVMVFIDAMAMCFSLWRTGDLWWAIGNHAAWDWGQTFLFGTPNSGIQAQHVLMSPSFHGPLLLAGGTDGPEGSVLVLVSEALFFLLIAVIYPRRRFPLKQDFRSSARVELDVGSGYGSSTGGG